MKQIVIEWPQLDRRVIVQLDPTRNRVLVDLLLQNLPYTVLQNHALVSGDHLYHTCPIIELVHAHADHVVADRTVCPDGTVFLSHLVHLGIKYGELSEYLPAAPVGQVVAEDIPVMKEVGDALWHAAYSSKRIIWARVYELGDTAVVDRYLPAPAAVSNPVVQQLVDELFFESNRLALRPPSDLLSLHEGAIESGAGSRGQYFTTMVFVNGEQRPFGYCAVGGLLTAARGAHSSLEMLREITPHFLKTPAAFLEYCGLKKQCDFVQRVQQALPLLRDKEEFHTLLSGLYMYTNLLNSWNLHLFPWDVGHSKYRYHGQLPVHESRNAFVAAHGGSAIV